MWGSGRGIVGRRQECVLGLQGRPGAGLVGRETLAVFWSCDCGYFLSLSAVDRNRDSWNGATLEIESLQLGNWHLIL